MNNNILLLVAICLGTLSCILRLVLIIIELKTGKKR
jgi:hypothetical protein